MTCLGHRNRSRIRTRSAILAASFIAVATLLTAGSASARIRYTISLASPAQHRFHVGVELDARPHQPDVTLALPAWNALYQIRDFSYRVEHIRANEPAREAVQLPVTALDKDTWRVAVPSPGSSAAPRTAVVDYSIEWNDSGPFNSQLNEHHAFMNLAEILMYAPERRSEDVEVQFDNLPSDWKLIAELPSGSDPNSFVASSYDALVDAPIEAGAFDEFEFDSGGAHFRAVVDSNDWNKSHLEDYLHRITACELQLMGGPPFKEYTFFFHIGSFLDVGGGGMEHANSTAISAGSTESAANIAAHEFFHAWNVKRIRPQTLEPIDYTREMYTRALWFAEGVTSTYASYTLERAGLWPKDQFYRDLESQINELESRPAHKWQSVEESSLDAWLEKYDAYTFPDRSISYYNKGQILGVMLDLAIRDATDDHKSLDDVMRLMNDEYARRHKFYNDSGGVRAAVEQVAGKSFEDFFRRYVAGVDEIPYNTFLNAAGLDLKLESAASPDLGFTLGRAPGSGLAVREVDQASPAASAGLREGDIILQIGGHDVPRGRRGFLRGLHPGDALTLRVNRAGQLLDISYVLGSREEDHYSLAEIPNPSDRQRRIRNGWLRGATD